MSAENANKEDNKSVSTYVSQISLLLLLLLVTLVPDSLRFLDVTAAAA